MYKKKRAKVSSKSNVESRKQTYTNLTPIDENPCCSSKKQNPTSQILTQKSNHPISAKNSLIQVHHHMNNLSDYTKLMDVEEDLLESQQSVPASQEPTQRRYLSQRGYSMTISKTHSKSICKPPDSYFEMVLLKTGVTIENQDNFVLSCDPLTYVNNLGSFLKRHNEFPENIKTFVEGYKEYLNNPFKEVKLLTGCMINIPNSGNEYQSQDSITMNFMMINILQEEIVEVLLKKIDKVSTESENFSVDIPILPLLLSQLKFVTTVHSEKLYERIIEIYEKATVPGRREIILSAEYILDASKHDEFVQYLIDNSESMEELLSTNNVKTFANLYLTSQVQTNIRKKIIKYIKDGCNISVLAIFMKFLLKFLHDDVENLFELVADIRVALEWNQTIENEIEVSKYQLEIFTYIKQGLIRSKKLCDVWQKSIQNLTESLIKPVDIIIYLMLMSIREERSLYIENLIRKQVKFERIKLSLITETRNLFLPLLNTYGEIFLQIMFNFVKEKTDIVREFAKNCFCVLFSVGDNYQKKILNKLVDFVCNKYSKEITTISLDILYMLNERFNKEVQNYGSLLMPMLDEINEIPLKQTRTVMQLMCSIAYPFVPSSGNPHLQEHIDMMIKKQICCRSSTVQKKGIIGMVQLINCIVRTEFTEDINIYDINESYQTANDLPEGKGKEAASYILRVFSATNHCINSLGLFYEELAIALSTKNSKENKAKVERHFLVWLCDLVTYYLQENFIKEIDQEEDKCEVEVSVQKCRNFVEDSITETDALNLAINITEPVFVPSIESHSSILILPPLFNLISVVQKLRSCGSLESVNAVLGCGIILPTFFEKEHNVEFFDKFGPEKIVKILDIHYHTINWYRAIISGFASQEDDLLRKKIILRIKDLIEYEELMRQYLTKAPVNYFPPLSQFNNFEEVNFSNLKRKERVKKYVIQGNKNESTNNSDNEMQVDENVEMTSLATNQTKNETVNNITKACNKQNFKQSKFDFIYGPKEIYREMDTDIILILRENFELTYPKEDDNLSVSLGLKEFKFLMQDLVSKVESIPGVKKLGNDVIIQNMCHSKYFVEKSEIYLGKIFKNLETMKNFLLELLIGVNGSLSNCVLFTDQVNYIKVCFSLCIRFIAGFFSYSAFDDHSYRVNLLNALKSISDEKSTEFITEIIPNVIEKLLSLEPAVVEIKAAFYLYNAVNSLQRFSVDKNFEKQIRTMCKVFLCRKWYNLEGTMEKGSYCNLLLDEIIKGFLKNSSTKRLKEILVAILTDCKNMKEKDSIVKSFPNIHKKNFSMLYKRLCETLIDSTNISINRNYSEAESLKIWENCCNNLNILLDILQSIDVPGNYSLYIKFSHSFIKIFLQNGLPSFEKSLKKSPERFNILLKNLQYNTRFLHNLCCHSKAIKNNAIVAQIPFVRETVEKLLYKVKAALAVNSCVSAFWMGPLKNRDIQGEEIHLSEPSNVNAINDDILDSSCVDETVINDCLGSVAKKTNTNQSRSDCY